MSFEEWFDNNLKNDLQLYTVEESAAYAFESAKEQYKSKWILFKDEQPKADQEVIVRSRSGYTSIAQYMSNGNNELIWSMDAGNYPPKDSDKWMEIPE